MLREKNQTDTYHPSRQQFSPHQNQFTKTNRKAWYISYISPHHAFYYNNFITKIAFLQASKKVKKIYISPEEHIIITQLWLFQNRRKSKYFILLYDFHLHHNHHPFLWVFWTSLFSRKKNEERKIPPSRFFFFVWLKILKTTFLCIILLYFILGKKFSVDLFHIKYCNKILLCLFCIIFTYLFHLFIFSTFFKQFIFL